jgi:signal transduction histidine kinase/CheY-like chemotaxis protein
MFLGLQLLCDDLQVNVCDEYQKPCETMMEVQSACRTAVETLNDLLCFDKLESGILKLHKHEVPVIPFLDNCVKMLGTQATEAQVTITNTSSIGTNSADESITTRGDKDELSPNHTSLLLHTDVVTMDKFKMDQVVRNLISNALKYTPRGGSITVCASFVPDIENDTVIFNDSERGNTVLYPFLPDSSSAFWKLQPCNAVLQYLLSNKKHSQIHMTDGYPSDIESGGLPSHSGPKIAPSDGSLTTVDVGAVLDTPDSRAMREDTVDPLNDSRTAADKPFTDFVTGKLRITVTDTGIGLTESSQRLLFKVIDRLNPELLAGEGRGLGLYITSRIVRMHGGTIRVESGGLGKGCSFIVDINMHRMNSTYVPNVPMTRINCAAGATGSEAKVFTVAVNPKDRARRKGKARYASDPPSRERARGRQRDRRGGEPMERRDPRVGPVLYSSVQRSSSAGFPLDSFRENFHENSDSGDYYDVLVVDDSRLNRKLLCRLFRQSGYICDEAEDGLSAVEKVKEKMTSILSSEKEYDAILMDFVMPVMDGPTATQIIRGLGYTGPIFGLTSNALESDVEHFLSKGANAVLAKPFDFGHFRRLMKTVDIYPENEGENVGMSVL